MSICTLLDKIRDHDSVSQSLPIDYRVSTVILTIIIVSQVIDVAIAAAAIANGIAPVDFTISFAFVA